ncbi:MAG: DUF58 domain-containing protein [Hydrogenophaga sp.]|jgi:uncharacterized protein (DUF58 family)|uniref:DUF58 domain-containing protein n=1 Tax=Hydrogenophaga sp. TaxID=1904254 RepID=UPI002A369580|nr:DUF58 domain-containing protein [Hydrogenophaga sp.]MDX9967406.1 DUF58 domain-containing protein [Hydrogenophaga sp.]
MPLAPDLSALPPPSPPPPGATPAGARSAGRLRARLRHWFHSRLPRTDTLALTQRNVYILPTRAGAMLALTLVLLLVASINYQLNLGYLLTFLLAGCAAMGMHVSHANLRGLSLHLTPPAPVHAGTAVQLEIRLANPGRQTRYGIGLSLDDTGHGQPPAWTDVPGQGNATVHVAWQVPSRGWHPVPVLSASTRFPLGTFRVWTVWRPATRLLAYPAIETHPPPLPPGEPQPGHAGTPVARNAGEFDGVRTYRRGDPLHAVVWKKAAQAMAAGRDDLVSRDTSGSQRALLWLDYASCGAPDPESRLSRLTAWVLQADRLDLAYGLRLPGHQIAPDRGAAHRSRCLEALATC